MSTSLKQDILNAVTASKLESVTNTNTYKETNWTQYGWICPKCGAVMAPFVSICINCRGNYNSEITTNIQINDLDKYISDSLLQKFNSITAKNTAPANYSISD
jgi:hypothetical protein